MDWPLHSFWRYRLVGLVHALTALNRNGHTGTGHEQRHDSEQRGARSTGERQLGDGLHVLHGGDLVVGRQSDLMEEILLEGNRAVLCNAHVEGDPEVLGVAFGALVSMTV